MRDNGDGIVVFSTITSTATASIDHCRLERNGSGLLAASYSRVTIRDSVAADNDVGFSVEAGSGTTAELNIENCVATGNSFNGIGVIGGGRSTVSVSNSTVTGNGTGILGF